MTGRKELADSLASVIDILRKCSMSNKAKWFSDRLQRIKSNPSDDVLIEVAKEVRSVIAGMGSYTDLSLQPVSGSGLSETEVQEMQWHLADDLDLATSRILKLGDGSTNLGTNL